MRFGEQRLVRPDVGRYHRMFFRAFGVAEPAHYLHWRYLHRALRHLEGPPIRRVLDAGCGGGDYSFYLARRFPQAQVLGIDIDGSLIERNRAAADRLGLRNLRFEPADLSRFEGSGFDLIVCIDVLEHIRDQVQAFRTLAGALQPGAIAFLHIPTVRTRPVPFSRWLHDFHDWAREEHVADELTADQVVDRVAGVGLEIQHVQTTFAWGAGEMANSLFSLPYRNTWYNRILQVSVAPLCRALTYLDPLPAMGPRYAVAVTARRPIRSTPGPTGSDTG